MKILRDFSGLFAPGSNIVPIIGGVPMHSAEVKLIEPPKIELVNSMSSVGEFSGFSGHSGHYAITVILDDMLSGRKILHANKFFINTVNQTIDIPGLSGYGTRIATGRRRLLINIEGECIADDTGEVATLYEE